MRAHSARGRTCGSEGGRPSPSIWRRMARTTLERWKGLEIWEVWGWDRVRQGPGEAGPGEVA